MTAMFTSLETVRVTAAIRMDDRVRSGTNAAASRAGGVAVETRGQTQSGARKVVLVVEDEPAIGRLIADAISDEPGYCAIHVAASTAALEATKHVTPDVMVIDVRLPGMSGFELYDQLQKDPRTSRVPVLFETASGAEAINEFRRRGIATYVKKPFDLNVIVAYVKRLATETNASSPPVTALPRRA
jgi:DNA-binding response OmpR family regulator